MLREEGKMKRRDLTFEFVLANEICQNLDSLINASQKERLKTALEIVMKAERVLHLLQDTNDKANGFYDRSLHTSMGAINISVPRDRNGNFRPAILPPPYQRTDDSYTDLLQSALFSFYSPNQLKDLLSSLELGYNEEEVKKLREQITREFQAWQARELKQDWMAIFIDAYQAEMLLEGKVKKVTLYSILGIDFEGQKELLGLYLCQGRETKDYWLQVFNDLIKRGLKRVLIVISDDFPGLVDAVATLFPGAFHQLCFVHLQRNVRRNMGKEDTKVFLEELQRIKLEQDLETGLKKFLSLLDRYEAKYPVFISHLRQRAENYLAFLHFPKEVRKYFYTTNAVESFHSMVERTRIRMGGFFQSKEVLLVNCYLQYMKLKRRRWAKPIPHIKANLYALRQLFAQIYGELPSI